MDAGKTAEVLDEIAQRSGGTAKAEFIALDLGDLDSVRHFADRIFDRSAGDSISMPPGPEDPSQEERDKLAEWLACGAP